MIISLIVAMDEEGGIGKQGRLPWHLQSDLKRFKAITMGHHIVMGRKTYESIGRHLPGRTMIVLTRRKGYHAEGCLVVDTFEKAIEIARNNNETELFIIGGGEVFTQSIDIADKIYQTTVQAKVGADVFYPQINRSEWETVFSEGAVQNEGDEYVSEFKVLIRKRDHQG